MNSYKKAENVALKYLNAWIKKEEDDFPEIVIKEYLKLYTTSPTKDVKKSQEKALNSL